MAIYADTDTFSGTIQALGGSGYEYGESGTTHLESSLIVGFTADPLSATAPLTVTFTNTTTGDVTGYEWAFGDDSTSVITHPTHVYTTTGVYTVSLTVTGPGISDTLTRTNYITVTSAAGEPVIITRVITYTYDPLNRLTEADYSTPSTGSGQAGEQFEYAYDEMGNRTVMTDVTGVTTYTYDLANRLSSQMIMLPKGNCSIKR
jgi:PKD repeat protein